MFSALKKSVIQHLAKMPGWRTNRKILVIESDDWGSIRMPSRQVYDTLLKKGLPVGKFHYSKLDSLASVDDLSRLFEVLSSVKDSRNNHPVITANVIMTNPDFEKIREDRFERYHFELFTETLKRYANHAGAFNLWKQGMQQQVFFPQFHGREHVNIDRWMTTLRRGENKHMRLAFDYGLFNLSEVENKIASNFFMDALNYQDPEEKQRIGERLSEGMQLFNDVFGYTAKSFIAPCYIWSSDFEKILAEKGIRYIQGGLFQKQPSGNNYAVLKKKYHYTGQRNAHNQIYTVRNTFFEPSSKFTGDWVTSCMREIEIAFKWKKPAIVCSHRVNYVGHVEPGNRDNSLRLLRKLLHAVVERWPEIEFMNSEQLGKTIETRSTK